MRIVAVAGLAATGVSADARPICPDGTTPAGDVCPITALPQLDLVFDEGNTGVAEGEVERLQQFASIVARVPALHVEIRIFGTRENQSRLGPARAETLRALLTTTGVDGARVKVRLIETEGPEPVLVSLLARDYPPPYF